MSKIGFIYKLACIDTEITEIYIGSTKNMRVRKGSHKVKCNNSNCNEHNYKVYQFIREHGGFDNWGLFQIEEIKYDTTFELHARERYHIELLKPALNMRMPNRPPLESSRAYYQKNKEELKEKYRERCQENKDETAERFREYYQKNKEELKIRSREYYKKHSKNIIDKLKEKFICECSGKYTRVNKSTHEKSVLHKSYIKQNNINNDID